MYYLAKIAQASGLTVIVIGFVSHFPRLINIKVFSTGLFLFIFGWIVENYLLKK